MLFRSLVDVEALGIQFVDGEHQQAPAYALSPVIGVDKQQFLPASDYARAGVVDYQKMAAVQEAFAARYLNEVK